MKISSSVWTILGLLVTRIAAQCAEYTDGRGPLCDGGPCRAGYYQVRTTSSGCWFGKKVVCRSCDVPTGCLAPQPFCWGFVKVCINGCGPPWVCGGCFGLGSSWFISLWKRQTDANPPRPSREEVLAAVDTMDIYDKRKGLASLKVKKAWCESDAWVNSTIRNMTETLIDGLHLIDPVASYDSWREGPELWVLRQNATNVDVPPTYGTDCGGKPCKSGAEQCDPSPPQNKCDITTSCIQTPPFPGEHHCACRAGYKADAANGDTSVHYRLPFIGQEYRVFVKPGVACNTLCNEWWLGPNSCNEVTVLPPN